MSKVVVINHLTLDGLTQAPGRPEEDGDPPASLRLVESVATTKGVVITTYQP